MSKPKIYLAGPEVFRPNPREVGDRLKAIVAKYGMEGVFPMDPVLADIKPGDIRSGLRIYNSDVQLVTACDAVVANMSPFRGPGMDGGTAFEMGMAIGQGKPVFGYSSDRRSYHEKVINILGDLTVDSNGEFRDGDDLAVEGFGMTDNLMMEGSVVETMLEHELTAPDDAVHATFEKAIQAAQLYFYMEGRLPHVGKDE